MGAYRRQFSKYFEPQLHISFYLFYFVINGKDLQFTILKELRRRTILNLNGFPLLNSHHCLIFFSKWGEHRLVKKPIWWHIKLQKIGFIIVVILLPLKRKTTSLSFLHTIWTYTCWKANLIINKHTKNELKIPCGFFEFVKNKSLLQM